ncbi:MAG TPA: hypothetical protein VN365_02920 [Candidatus Thermoplasmatota archaeon]|nr:hypothetical protein [Candidatus Thermoplasmatota archaeon]
MLTPNISLLDDELTSSRRTRHISEVTLSGPVITFEVAFENVYDKGLIGVRWNRFSGMMTNLEVLAKNLTIAFLPESPLTIFCITT